MCVIYRIDYTCGHYKFLDDPPVTQCDDMAEASTPAHPVYCETDELYVPLKCDNLCPGCSAGAYLMEKRYAISQIVLKAGGRVRDLQPLPPHDVCLWAQWRTDRERFRSAGVNGGEGGELGQGWQPQGVGVPGKKNYGEACRAWMTDRYRRQVKKMVGWKEDLGFDGFLGEVDSFEPREWKGLTVSAVYEGVRYPKEEPKA